MPRRVYTYPAEMGWGGLNLLASAGAAIMVLALLIYLRQHRRQPAPRRRRRDEPLGRGRRWSGRRPRRRRRTTSSRCRRSPAASRCGTPTGRSRWSSASRPTAARCWSPRVLDAEPDHRYEIPSRRSGRSSRRSASPACSSARSSPRGQSCGGRFRRFVAMVFWFWPDKGYSPRELEARLEAGELTPREQVL